MNLGKIINTRFGKKAKSSDPRSVPKTESLPPRPNEEQREETSPQYSYATPVALDSSQETVEHPDPSITPTLRRPYPTESRPALSRFPDPTTQPPPFRYQDQNLSNPPSEWPAPGRFPQQNPTQVGETASSHFHGQYSDPYGWTPNYDSKAEYGTSYRGPAAPSHFIYQSTVQRPSVAPSVSHFPSRGPALSPGAPLPRQYGALPGQNTTLGYQNQYSTQTVPSGLGSNSVLAARNPYLVENPVQQSRSNYFPGSTGGRPQSMYVSYAHGPNPGVPPLQTEGPASYEGDFVDDMTRDMAYSTLTTRSRRESSAGMLF